MNNVRPISGKAEQRKNTHQLRTKDRTLQLVTALHSTLDLKHVVLYFTHALVKMVRCEGVAYAHEESSTNLLLGKEQTHSFNYTLTADDLPLGDIKIMRSTPFNDVEIMQLEDCLCLLIGPLKNAVSHHRALYSANHDPLTSVQNRLMLKPSLNREIKLAQRYKIPLSILMLDIDDFKKINDTFGHLAGDQVLADFAARLSESVRDTDLVFRVGGEEFITILSKTDAEGARILGERICEYIAANSSKYHNKSIKITTSIGMAELGSDDSYDTFIERADAALYRAKQEGKNRVV